MAHDEALRQLLNHFSITFLLQSVMSLLLIARFFTRQDPVRTYFNSPLHVGYCARVITVVAFVIVTGNKATHIMHLFVLYEFGVIQVRRLKFT